MPISQSGQTHSNNSSANWRRIVWVCLTILWDWRLKVNIHSISIFQIFIDAEVFSNVSLFGLSLERKSEILSFSFFLYGIMSTDLDWYARRLFFFWRVSWIASVTSLVKHVSSPDYKFSSSSGFRSIVIIVIIVIFHLQKQPLEVFCEKMCS